jgi:hypothetical protein
VATAFLRHWIYEYNNRDVRGQWQTILNELTDVTGDLFLGLGVQCARCHDHKFDPILQKDYYRLQAFFAPLLPRQDLTVASEAEATAYRNRLAAWRDAAGDSLRELEQFEEPVRARAAESALGKFPEDIQALLRKPEAEQTLLERQLSALAHRQIEYEWARLATHLKKEEKEPYEALQKRIKEFAALRPEPLPAAFTVTDLGPEAPPVFLPKSRDSVPVEPGFLSVLDPRPTEIVRPETIPQSTGRRATLASWLVSPDNPLAARVLVNRVWQYHFGRGLAANSSDFGHLGEPPSHPELLDWLAARFVRDGWSLKQLHRWILTSATYGQAAVADSGAATTDPENRWLGRFPTRRLEAEQIRDALFAVTGELDLASGGPAADAARPRRTVFTRVTRNVRDPLLAKSDVRLALSQAIDRATLVNERYLGLYLPTTSWVPPTISGLPGGTYDSVLGYAPEAARASLARAGYPGGKGFPGFTLLTASPGVGTFLQTAWQTQLGISVTVEVVDSVSLDPRFNNHSFQVALYGWAADPDPGSWFLGLWETAGSHNRAGTAVPALDALIKKANANTNEAERVQQYRDAERLLLQGANGIAPLWETQHAYLVKPHISGMAENRGLQDQIAPGDSTPERWSTTKP